jgi:hypothetical protein
MKKFMKAIETLTNWIGHDKRSGNERRVKVSKRKTTKRKAVRRKKK